QYRGPQIIWIGRVSSSGDGSRIELISQESPLSRAFDLAVLCGFGAFCWPAIRAGYPWLLFPVVGFVFVIGLLALSNESSSFAQRDMCAAVVAQVTDARSTTPAPAA